MSADRRAKSTSARDLRYGRQGGRWLPLQTDAEQAEAFAAVAIYGECFCTYWWLIDIDLGSICKHCNEPRQAAS